MSADIPLVASIPSDHIKAHLLIAATGKDCRFYLNGILLDAPCSRLVSTDGHGLLVSGLTLSAKARKIPRFIIPREALEKLLKTLPKSTGKQEQLIEVRCDAQKECGPRSVELRSASETVHTKEVSTEYPNYSKVVPVTCSGELAQLDWPLLYRMQRALNLAQGKSTVVLPIHVRHNGGSPALVSCKDPLLLGVVMPGYGERDTTQTALKRLGFLEAAPAAKTGAASRGRPAALRGREEAKGSRRGNGTALSAKGAP